MTPPQAHFACPCHWGCYQYSTIVHCRATTIFRGFAQLANILLAFLESAASWVDFHTVDCLADAGWMDALHFLLYSPRLLLADAPSLRVQQSEKASRSRFCHSASSLLTCCTAFVSTREQKYHQCACRAFLGESGDVTAEPLTMPLAVFLMASGGGDVPRPGGNCFHSWHYY